MEKEVVRVIKYFHFFNYSPNFTEVYTFLSKKTSKKALKMAILKLERQKKIKRIKNCSRYTLPEYTITSQKSKFKSQNYNSKVKSNNTTIEQYNNFIKEQQISKAKLNSLKFKLYLKLLTLFPQIKLIGLSGSIAMMNASHDDDIDLFIITAKNRLWTGRFLAVTIAFLMGLKRQKGLQKAPDKVCLNLFFNESNLTVPSYKKTEFVAHEVLQMKPIFVKGDIYERFLKANQWVRDIFPNSSWINSKFKIQNSKLQFKSKNFKFLIVIFHFSFFIFNLLMNGIELCLLKLQLTLINRHKTSEIITNTQLWFHPKDYSSFM